MSNFKQIIMIDDKIAYYNRSYNKELWLCKNEEGEYAFLVSNYYDDYLALIREGDEEFKYFIQRYSGFNDLFKKHGLI